jgi:hypothetical protein
LKVHGLSFQDKIVPTSKARDKIKRPSLNQDTEAQMEIISREDLRVDYFLKSTRSSGATPIGCTSGAPHGLSFQAEIVPTSKARDKIKRPTLNQDTEAQMEIISREDLRVDYFLKSTRSSGATPIGCTSGAPNEVQNPTN